MGRNKSEYATECFLKMQVFLKINLVKKTVFSLRWESTGDTMLSVVITDTKGKILFSENIKLTSIVDEYIIQPKQALRPVYTLSNQQQEKNQFQDSLRSVEIM